VSTPDQAEPSPRQPDLEATSATASTSTSNREMGLSSAEAATRLDREGLNEVPEKKSHPFIRLARKFWGLSAWMIELIIIVSFILGKRADLWIAL